MKATFDQYLELGQQIKRGEIPREAVQALIEQRLALPAIGSMRETQARRLYELRFGDVLGAKSFDEYLNGTDAIQAVPQLPVWPATHLRLFGAQNIFLIDGRVAEKVGIEKYCELVGLAYYGENDTLEAHDAKRAKSGIRWMLGQDGYRNRNRKANDCREGFQSFEVGMDWVEGGGLYGLNPKVMEDHCLDLPGSVLRGYRDDVACMGRFRGVPELHWGFGGDANPCYGAASRSECSPQP